jgi:hypothetical protein
MPWRYMGISVRNRAIWIAQGYNSILGIVPCVRYKGLIEHDYCSNVSFISRLAYTLGLTSEGVELFAIRDKSR